MLIGGITCWWPDRRQSVGALSEARLKSFAPWGGVGDIPSPTNGVGKSPVPVEPVESLTEARFKSFAPAGEVGYTPTPDESPTSTVGADLSCPSPIYRPAGEG